MSGKENKLWLLLGLVMAAFAMFLTWYLLAVDEDAKPQAPEKHIVLPKQTTDRDPDTFIQFLDYATLVMDRDGNGYWAYEGKRIPADITIIDIKRLQPRQYFSEEIQNAWGSGLPE